MKGDKYQKSSIHIWLSETKGLLSTFVVFFIFTTDVASVMHCSADSGPLLIDCVYMRAEGILCKWNWRNVSAIGPERRQNITATMVLNNTVGIPSQSCTGQEVNTNCRFENVFDDTTLFSVSAIVDDSLDGEVYKSCNKFSVLLSVRYEKPRDVLLYPSSFDFWQVDIVWQFPSDYPKSSGVLRTWSFCKVRWSENLGPWKYKEVAIDYYCTIMNINPTSTYNVQVTCLGRYSNKENWTTNKTLLIQSAPNREISPVSPVHVISVRTTRRSSPLITTKVTLPPLPSSQVPQEQTSEQSTLKPSTQDRNTIITIPPTTPISTSVMLGSSAPLALGIAGAILFLMVVLIGGFILTYRYRKTVAKGNKATQMAEELNGQVSDISRWLSKDELLVNASLGKNKKKMEQIAL